MPCPTTGTAIDGAYRHSDVNIGWYPFRTTRATDIRTLPGEGTGHMLEALDKGTFVGVQSERNPHMHKDPERRKAVARDGKQYVWGYRRGKGDVRVRS